jgi:hypothetical protein
MIAFLTWRLVHYKKKLRKGNGYRGYLVSMKKFILPAVVVLLMAMPGGVWGKSGKKSKQPAQPSRDVKSATELGLAGKGICVQLGCEDTTALMEAIKENHYLAQGLAYEQEDVAKARKLICEANLYGQGSVRKLEGNKLSYADNLINLLVVEDFGKAKERGISLSEMLRVTCPSGTVVINKADKLSKTDKASLAAELTAASISGVDLNSSPVRIIKPRPKGMGEWTHARQGPEANPVSPDVLVGPPTSLRWITGPGWPRAGKSNGLFETLSADGVNVYFTNGNGNESEIENRVSILARDAYNSVKLWERHWSATRSYGNGNFFSLMHVMAVHKGRLFATGNRSGPFGPVMLIWRGSAAGGAAPILSGG